MIFSSLSARTLLKVCMIVSSSAAAAVCVKSLLSSCALSTSRTATQISSTATFLFHLNHFRKGHKSSLLASRRSVMMGFSADGDSGDNMAEVDTTQPRLRRSPRKHSTGMSQPTSDVSSIQPKRQRRKETQSSSTPLSQFPNQDKNHVILGSPPSTPELGSESPSASSLPFLSPSVVTPVTPLSATLLSPSKRSKRTLSSKKALFTPDDNPSSASRISNNSPIGLTSADVAQVNPSVPFYDLGLPPEELRPSRTLTTGQCFNWQALVANGIEETSTVRSSKVEASSQLQSQSAWGIHNAVEWIGTLRVEPNGESIVLVIRETTNSTFYRVLHAPTTLSQSDIEKYLRSYFQIDPRTSPKSNTSNSIEFYSLKHLYHEWSTRCERMAKITKCLPGVRVLNQDPWECLVSFICSSNNNIPRITKMLAAIRRQYGQPLLRIPTLSNHQETNDNAVTLYSFPSLEELLSRATEEDLRNSCGMGYRANYIIETIKTLKELGGEQYLHELRTISDPYLVQEKLCQFCGVGRKVADCVALFSLQQDSAIPVDVHVWEIARRDYDHDDRLLTTAKSMTPSLYKQVGGIFRERFPVKAGWAHSLLFVAELPSFRPALTAELVAEMEKFRVEEQKRKDARKTKTKS